VTEKKIIAVVGGTGKQGGSMVRAILDDPDGPFTARVLTRNPGSDRAKALAERGVEVVAADLDNEQSVRLAFDGAYGAFVVTNYWEQRTEEEVAERSAGRLELEQARNAANAAKAAGIKHVVWSTLEDTRPYFSYFGSDVPDLEDEFKVPHFDAKAAANGFFTDLGVPTTFLETTFYYEAFLGGLGPHRDADGQLVLTLPMRDGVLSMVATEDIGRMAYGIFLAGPRFVGRTLGLAGDHLSGEQIAKVFTAVLGERVVYRPASTQQLRAAGQEEMANMFDFYAYAVEPFMAHRDLDQIRSINPRLRSLEDWLIEHREQLPID
jgi:uncharacterized protein YbjT (DUF2867 family)